MIKIQLACVVLSSIIMMADGLLLTASNVDALEVMRALMQGREAFEFGQENRDTIKFWVEAVNESGEVMCNVDYMRKLAAQMKADSTQTTMINMKDLYKYSMYKLLGSCSADLDDKAEEFGSQSVMKDYALGTLGYIYNRWVHGPYDPEYTYRYMAEYMLKVVGYDKINSQSQFIEAWQNGPCRTILDQLEQPGMESLKNFVTMVNESELDPLSVNSFELRYDIPMIQFCQYIQWQKALKKVWIALQERDPELEQHVQAENF